MARLGKIPGKFKRQKPVKLSRARLVEMTPISAESHLPLMITPTIDGVSLPRWITDNHEQMVSLLHKHGALLFRNFAVEDPAAFYEVANAVTPDILNYTERSSPRHAVAEKVYTSTDYPKEQHIFLHNENSYQALWPMKLMFYCQIEPGSGGETPLADCRRIFERIDPAIFEKFERKGVMYVRNFTRWSNVKWQTTFGSDDPDEVIAYCKTKGMRAIFRDDNTSLRTEVVRPLVSYHPITGDRVWFNHVALFHYTTLPKDVREDIEQNFSEEDLPSNAYYGDGSPIEAEVLEAIRNAYQQEKVLFPWKRRDVLLVDNMLTAHGRSPYDGDRKILVSMGEAHDPSTQQGQA